MTIRWQSRVALCITICFWASAFVAIRIALKGGYTPGSLAFLRYLIASLMMIPVYCRLRTKPPLRLRDLPLLIGVGVIGFGLYNVCLNGGELSVSAGIAAFMIGLVPVISALIAILFLGERLGPLALLGIGISVFGVLLIAISGHDAHVSYGGIALLLMAALSMSVYSTLQKPLLTRLHAVQFVSLAMWIGTLVLLIYLPDSYREVQHASPSATLAIIYLGIFPGAIAYALWSFVLSHMPACKTVTAMYALPLLATLLGVIFLGEIPQTLALVGGVVSLCGACVVRVFSKARE